MDKSMIDDLKTISKIEQTLYCSDSDKLRNMLKIVLRIARKALMRGMPDA